MQFIKSLFAKWLTKPAIDALGAKLKSWLHNLVDIVVAYLIMQAYNWMNQTNNDVIMQDAGVAGFTGWVGVLFAIAGLVTRLLPWILKSHPPASILLLGILSFPAGLQAAPIVGPSVVPTAHFTSDIPKTSSAVWVVIPKPEPGGFQTNDDGSFDFWGPPGKYTVLLVEVVRDGSQVRTEQVVELGGAAPPTPPNPPPNPDVPNGAHGFTKWAYATVAAFPAADRPKGHQVAAFLRTIAGQLKAGQPITISLSVGETKTFDSTPTGLQQATSEWISTFGGSWKSFPSLMGKQLKDSKDFKKTPTDYVESWIAFSDGIDKAVEAGK